MEGESATILSDGRLAKRRNCEQGGEGVSTVLEVRALAMESMEARLLNISETGLGIRTAGELQLGQLVTLAGDVRENMPRKAVVMWSRQEESGYRSGLKFLQAS
ncbi:MAG: PilZ domain-containing protein [Thermodesulfobacteriota bacterium]